MNVRTICLAILYEGEASGYEIRKLSVEGEYAYFIDASFGSIYPALAKLEVEGLVTSVVQQQDGKPAKKVYAITASGRRAFINSLFDKLGEDEFRSEFLLFARFAGELPASLVETRLRERLDELDRGILDLEGFAGKVEAPADRWVLDYGRACLTVARDYVATHMNELVALAKPDTGEARAAE